MLEDRQIVTSLVMYVRSITDTLFRSQMHSILCAFLYLMVNVPATARYLESEVNTGPVIFATLLDLLF